MFEITVAVTRQLNQIKFRLGMPRMSNQEFRHVPDTFINQVQQLIYQCSRFHRHKFYEHHVTLLHGMIGYFMILHLEITDPHVRASCGLIKVQIKSCVHGGTKSFLINMTK